VDKAQSLPRSTAPTAGLIQTGTQRASVVTLRKLDVEAYFLAQKFIAAHLDMSKPSSEAIIKCMQADPLTLPHNIVVMAQNAITECEKYSGLGEETMFMLMESEALDAL
jgi:hypothetical protein